jgi:hypothetical protein
MSLVLGVIVVVVVLYYFVSRGDERAQQDSSESEDELVQLCLGDRTQAERLLALEKGKARGIDRGEAARRAIRSLRRDVR